MAHLQNGSWDFENCAALFITNAQPHNKDSSLAMFNLPLGLLSSVIRDIKQIFSAIFILLIFIRLNIWVGLKMKPNNTRCCYSVLIVEVIIGLKAAVFSFHSVGLLEKKNERNLPTTVEAEPEKLICLCIYGAILKQWGVRSGFLLLARSMILEERTLFPHILCSA